MLEKIEISGYRLLDGFTADFGNLTVVIGGNATGKSTLLDCLQLVSHCAEYPINPVISEHGGFQSILCASTSKQSIGWALQFHTPSNPAYWHAMGLESTQSLSYESVLSIGADGLVVPELEILRNTDPYVGYSSPLKYLEVTPHRSMVFNRSARRLVSFDSGAAGTTGDSPANGGSQTEQVRPPVTEPALRISQMRFYGEFPVPSFCRLLFASMAFYPGFDIGRRAPLRLNPAEIRPVAVLASNGDNLGTVLHEVFTRYDYQSSANDLREFLRVAFPHVDAIAAETTYGAPPRVQVRIREGGMNRAMELWDLSDGMIRFLCLATALLAPVPPPFVAVDEPEAGMHPRLLPIIADMIHTASERTQVVVTTHSPYLLSQFQLEDIAVLRRENAKVYWTRPATRASLMEMLRDVAGDTIADLHKSGELESYL